MPIQKGPIGGTVETGELVDGSVTTAKIANSAVTSGKLATGAAVANIGYTPANKAGDTFTGPVIINSGGHDQFRFTDGTQNMYFDTDNNGVAISGGPLQTLGGIYIHNSVGNISLFTNNALRMTVDTAGRITKPFQPAFFVGKNNANPLTGPATVVFNSVTYNTGSHYNSTTGIFTAPIAGRYAFFANITSASGVDDLLFAIRINGVTVSASGTQSSVQAGQELSGCLAGVFNLAANDQVTVYTDRNLRCDSTAGCNFSGYLVS